MSPDAVQKLSDWLLHPEAANRLRGENGSVPARGWVAELSSYLRLADPELYQHSLRVARWARRTALHLGFDRGRLRVLNVAARFHDIGKVPFLHLVHKPGPLSLRERGSLDSHPALGARMLSELGPPFGEAAPLVEAHHQRYDMDGKPALLGARVIAVVDAYDAMTSARAYHRPSHPVEAFKEILRQSGRQFDPVVVAAFLDLPHFIRMVDGFTLGTLKAAAERIVAKDKRNAGFGVGWVRRTFSDAAGVLWEAIEGEGQGMGVAPGFRRIVLRRLESPDSPPVPGPITVAPLEVLPAEWLRGFVRLVEDRPDLDPARNGKGRGNGNGAGHAEVAVAADPEPAVEPLEEEDAELAEDGGASDDFERMTGAVEDAVEEAPVEAAESLPDEPIVAVDCAEVADAGAPAEDVPDWAQPAATRRHLFRGLDTEHVAPHSFRARVRIALGDREFEGEAVGADVPGARADVAARAALAALQDAEDAGFELALQGAKVVRAFDRKLVVVGVYALRGRDVTSLVGAALVRDSVEQAGVHAALQATNRWVTWAASQAGAAATP
ncbi:MAG: HD-GYP domain-containing protein [Gemmatimonadota bacterium]